MLSAHGVEGRFPFLDHHVIEFLAGIPENYRLRGMNDKAILREAYRKDLPDDIFTRPKFAFRAPELHAFLGDADGFVAEMLSPDALEEVGIFDLDVVRRFHYRLQKTPPDRFSTRDNLAFVQILTTQILHRKMVRDFSSVPTRQSNDVVITRS